MIVSPWGEVVAKLNGDYKEPQIASAEINSNLLARVRKGMPLHRRVDLYPKI
jgi:predicted amidohydrolase